MRYVRGGGDDDDDDNGGDGDMIRCKQLALNVMVR